MRIAIMGAGGVGSYFGARLAASGEDVTFISRGRHLSALGEHGMSLKSPRGDLRLEKVVATDDPSTVGTVDVVLVTVKLYDLRRKSGKTLHIPTRSRFEIGLREQTQT